MFSISTAEGTALTALITIASGCGFALFGYDQGVFGAFLANDSFVATFNNPSPTLQGHMTATYDLGCFFGAIATMWYGQKIGSRKNIMIGCTVLIIGAVLQTCSYHSAQLIIGRLVAGIGNGMNTSSIPVWQSETAPARHRGHVMVLQLCICQTGQLISQWLNYGMTYVATNSVSWRFPLAFQCVFALITMSLVPLLPDSPRWLLTRNRVEEAYQIQRRLEGPKVAEEEVRQSLDEMNQIVQHEMSFGKIYWKSLLKNDKLQTTRRLILGAGTQFMQQWTGINSITYYLPVVFAALGINRNLSLILAGCSSINFLIWTALGAIGIERFGRKNLMIWGSVLESLCLTIVAISLAIGGTHWQPVSVTFIFGFVSTFGATWIAVPWMYPAEVNTQRMRVAGAGLATATNWINNYAVVLITPLGIANLRWKYYIIYAVINAAFVPVLLFFYVETARLSLEEIDVLFEAKYSSNPDVPLPERMEEVKDKVATHIDVVPVHQKD